MRFSWNGGTPIGIDDSRILSVIAAYAASAGTGKCGGGCGMRKETSAKCLAAVAVSILLFPGSTTPLRTISRKRHGNRNRSQSVWKAYRPLPGKREI
jgi:hypothetical protein